jgi:DNA-binding transcriptional MerR regulator
MFVNEIKTLPNLMPIGAFAKRTRLSYKALRLYDAMGLLPPAFVDEGSSYRYYSEEQVEKAKLIGLLRQLEMPLNRIANVLTLPGGEASRAIALYWGEVEADARVKRRLVHYLETYLEGKGERMFEIQSRDIPEQKVLTIQGKVYVKDLPKFISNSMMQLYTHIGGAGITASATNFVAYHGQINEDSDGPVEVCVPFTGSLEPAGEMRIRLEPAHHEAYTRLTKAQVEFPSILEAYDAVHKHLKEQGKTSSDSPREVYFVDWNQTKENDPACDIAVPFEKETLKGKSS